MFVRCSSRHAPVGGEKWEEGGGAEGGGVNDMHICKRFRFRTHRTHTEWMNHLGIEIVDEIDPDKYQVSDDETYGYSK